MKSTAARAIIDALTDHAAEFTARQKGQEYRAILFTLSDVFGEDRQAIRNLTIGERKAVKKGTGTVRRTKVGTSNTVRLAASGSNAAGGCVDCPDAIVPSTVAKVPPPRKTVSGRSVRALKDGGTIGGRQPATAGGDPARLFADVDDVIARFENDGPLMLSYCQARDIAVGNARKPATLAKYILEAQNTEEE